MDHRNGNESMTEGLLDEAEGADILMVKPALAYMDVIFNLRQHTLLPIACYNVSGEYSMVKAAAQKGWIDEQKIVIGFHEKVDNPPSNLANGAVYILSTDFLKILKDHY